MTRFRDEPRGVRPPFCRKCGQPATSPEAADQMRRRGHCDRQGCAPPPDCCPNCHAPLLDRLAKAYVATWGFCGLGTCGSEYFRRRDRERAAAEADLEYRQTLFVRLEQALFAGVDWNDPDDDRRRAA